MSVSRVEKNVLVVLSDSLPPPVALLFNIYERQNPNYVPATLNGLVMTMFHEDSAGEEVPLGVVVYSGKGSARLPARGSAIVQAEVRNHMLRNAWIILCSLKEWFLLREWIGYGSHIHLV